MKIAVYGAKSIALGVEKAVKLLYPECSMECFLVGSLENNPAWLDGLQVREIGEFADTCGRSREDIHILVGTPQDQHPAIVEVLQRYGYRHFTCMDAGRESRLMERYFDALGGFPCLHGLPVGGRDVSLQVFEAVSGRDKKLGKGYDRPAWACPLQAGAALHRGGGAGFLDDTGENISEKNGNYCELTALYWIWKNVLGKKGGGQGQYYGLFQYRRGLDMTKEDLGRLWQADVVLPYPTLHEPDIREHHARYIAESDWEAMLCALKELHPEYAGAFPEVFGQPYFYNYNLVIARREVLADYCAWLFPVLARTEELSVPKGGERSDRYIGYIGESLLTLYFLYHKNRLKIYHTGRYMLV